MDTNQIIALVAVVVFIAAILYFLWLARTVGRAQAIEQLTQLADVIRYAVNEANAMYEISNDDKYSHVFVIASDWLHDRGIEIPADNIRQMIEGAVDIVKRAKN
jgi:uncharacterized membrane protein